MHLLSIMDMGSQWGTPDFKRRWWSNGGKNQNPQEIPEPIINPPIFLESIEWYNMKKKITDWMVVFAAGKRGYYHESSGPSC